MSQRLSEGTVTVLFTDVVGSTAMRTSQGDAFAQEMMRAHFDLVRREVESHSGEEVKTTGDGVMVAFASARRALACAVAIQRAHSDRNRSLHPDQQLLVRIGLNAGEVIREEEDLFGEAVNAAARIAAKAKGNEILVSETVRGIMGHAREIQLIDRGRFRLRGFPERWRLFEVPWQEEPVAVAPPAMAERTPFVGREAEREELRGCLERALSGQGSLVMMGGEPGVGKTRLAEEAAVEGREKGMLTLSGRCYDMTGAPPYVPFVEALEAAGRALSVESLRAALGESAPEVAKLVPELRRTFPNLPPPPELPPEQERRYLFNGVRDFIARAAGTRPLLMVLDDLQWADESTMLLLLHLAQQLAEVPVLVLGTYRDVEAYAGSPLARALEELTRHRLAHRMTVKPFDEAGVGAMLRALGGTDPPRELVEVIWNETDGSPFFVEEVVKHLAEEGRLFDEHGDWRGGLAITDTDVPESLRLVIDRRLERLDDNVRRVLTSAAVLGRSFSFDLLTALSETDGDALLDAVDEAERAQLLTSTSDGPQVTFRFSHELIRQTLLSGVSAARRQHLHLQVATALERAQSHAEVESAPDLAYHLQQAGDAADSDKTARYLALAGDQAFSTAAFEEALAQYANALSLVPPDDRPGRADLLYKRGLAHRSLGRWDEALRDWRESLKLHESLGDIEAAGRIYAAIVRHLLWDVRYLEAVEFSQRGLITIGNRETPERVLLLSAVGVALSLAGFYGAAQGAMGRALALARRIGDKLLLARVLAYSTVHHFSFGQMREQAENGLQAIEPLRSAGDLWDLADVLWATQIALIARGRLAEAASVGEELEPLAARLGHLGAQQFAARHRAFAELLVTADLDKYEEFAKADLDFSIRSPLPGPDVSYTLLGLANFWKGRWPEALHSVEEGAKRELPGMNGGLLWAGYVLTSAYARADADPALLLRRRRGEEAITLPLGRLLSLVWSLLRASRYSGVGLRALLGMVRDMRRSRVSDFLPRAGRANTIGSWALLLSVVECWAMAGKPRASARLYPQVLEALERTGSLVRVFEPRLIETVAAISAAAGRRWEQAETHYQTALRQADELPHKLEQPEVRRWYARMLLDRDGPGDRQKALDLLDEAIAMYRRIGMSRHLELAEEWRRSAAGARPAEGGQA